MEANKTNHSSDIKSVIGNRLRAIRLSLNLKTSQVVEKLSEMGYNISVESLYHYEQGRSTPQTNIFFALCKIYHIPIEDCFFYSSNAEVEFLQNLRDLDQESRDNYFSLIKKQAELTKRAGKTNPGMIRLPYYGKIAAAGQSVLFSDIIETEYRTFPDTKESQAATFCIGVSGDSMEPTFYDGDIVYVNKNTVIYPGDIGIFQVGNEVYIKELGDHQLISHNSKYPPIRTEDQIIYIGKVIGKASNSLLT